jgi:hypothetical protein
LTCTFDADRRPARKLIAERLADSKPKSKPDLRGQLRRTHPPAPLGRCLNLLDPLALIARQSEKQVQHRHCPHTKVSVCMVAPLD